MESHLAKGSFHPPKMKKETLRRRMGKTQHQPKELCTMNAMAMGI